MQDMPWMVAETEGRPGFWVCWDAWRDILHFVLSCVDVCSMEVDADRVAGNLRPHTIHFLTAAHVNPRLCHSHGAKQCTHAVRWFAHVDRRTFHSPNALLCLLKASWIMHFRLGGTDIAINSCQLFFH